jgi:hypothetical protein
VQLGPPVDQLFSSLAEVLDVQRLDGGRVGSRVPQQSEGQRGVDDEQVGRRQPQRQHAHGLDGRVFRLQTGRLDDVADHRKVDKGLDVDLGGLKPVGAEARPGPQVDQNAANPFDTGVDADHLPQATQ